MMRGGAGLSLSFLQGRERVSRGLMIVASSMASSTSSSRDAGGWTSLASMVMTRQRTGGGGGGSAREYGRGSWMLSSTRDTGMGPSGSMTSLSIVLRWPRGKGGAHRLRWSPQEERDEDPRLRDPSSLPISIMIGRGNEHESRMVFPLLDGIRVHAPNRRGRPRKKPMRVHADKN
jgi:hypothetical protein